MIELKFILTLMTKSHSEINDTTKSHFEINDLTKSDFGINERSANK